jgi:hypothetical protein
MEDKEKKVVKENFQLVTVATETAEVIKDIENDTALNANQALCLLLNEVRELRKRLG